MSFRRRLSLADSHQTAAGNEVDAHEQLVAERVVVQLDVQVGCVGVAAVHEYVDAAAAQKRALHMKGRFPVSVPLLTWPSGCCP